ncbi:MAG TPA: hypothetical protein DEO56_05830 [Nitrosomonas nitrosa]|uniref:Uncharacterized protein n=1 Tax=Nitrosomonas nitrosa TaxID=52442 RepID=A0A1I4KRJ8_9PROT|nr:hypothetical protein [Nitrosomonas nitrosa]PTQ89107.1 hypothetical protein C8R30_1465 [Nitrosomonas nitrosa]CAE6512573.1 hypothetical protein NMYAN_40138 [Nitrosomonas nitrosa]SFL81233.1 hypothetical protein SAMN05421880_1012 [Nitrosomonas nitrosa]HBZ30102.1 hypothetical protein [Nitrosomonas nitrosa]HNP52561.1 hypothetical protein [Nitrosomonas nitrosa]
MNGFIQPTAFGNAIRLPLSPVLGASKWRVLRKESDDFSGHDDPNAYLVYEGYLQRVGSLDFI